MILLTHETRILLGVAPADFRKGVDGFVALCQSSCLSIVRRTKRHSAYRLSKITIKYRWHPMNGQTIHVTRKVKRHGCDTFHFENGPGRPREIPAWMADTEQCSAMSAGNAQVSINALQELRRLLDTLVSAKALSEVSLPLETDNAADPDQPESPIQARPGGGASARTGTGGTRADDRGVSKPSVGSVRTGANR